LSEDNSKKEWCSAFEKGYTNMDFETWQWSHYIMEKEVESGSFNCSCGGVTQDFICNKCDIFFEELFIKYRGDNKSDS